MAASSTERVRTLAHDAGFDLVGFARYAKLDGTALDAWLERGFHGKMVYMARGRDARLDPALLLPSVRTVIALAINYWHPGSTELPGGGRISRYAWGRDYHKVLGTRLKTLRRSLSADFTGVESWGGVDGVPIMEKVWAQRAGIGWIGKNGNLLTRRYGSWVFLSSLLVSLELEPDPPHADHCGTCTDCLTACPTKAIVSPGVVDANKCLSYHSIEHTDPWPADVAAKAGGWVFGCDICQDVCPWSIKFVEEGAADFAPRDAVMSRSLDRWAGQSEAQWDEATRGTALRRPGYEGMVRNARTVSGKR